MLNFEVVLELFLISLMPISVSIIMRLIQKYTSFKKLKRIYQQIIIGVIFGIISILGTVFGIATTSGAIINIRDVPPICAGLIFGGPAGIIAGFMGGIYRYVSVYFGLSGAYTQIACSVSTICAGFFTAIIRKYVFDGHHGKWYYGLGLGVLCESFHMLMVFFTHMDDIESAYYAVINCVSPMILVNSLAVMFSVIGVAIVSKEKVFEHTKPLNVSSIVQLCLVISLLIAYSIISFFTYYSLQNISDSKTYQLLSASVEDLQNEVDDQIDRRLQDICLDMKLVVDDSIANGEDYEDMLVYLVKHYGLTEVSFINKQNVIEYSNDKSIVNYDMYDGKQSRQFYCLLKNIDFFTQPYQERSLGSGIYRKYAGFRLYRNDDNLAYVQIGYDTDTYHKMLNEYVTSSAVNRRVGNNGYLTITDEEGNIISQYKDFTESRLFDVKNLTLNEMTTTSIELNGNQDIYYYAINLEGYYVISWAYQDSCDLDKDIALLATSLTESFIFLTMFCILYIIIKKYVVNSILHVNKSLNKISDGDLNVTVDERTSYEFNSLSDDINRTVDTLKGFIDRESKKIAEELKFAKNIQESSLPTTFPAFPTISSVDLYATMTPAKEVGGDFYDFYRVGEDKVAILIADVSGKGIPAAMFMMKAKSIIKGLAESGLEVNEVITQANNQLCEGNDAQMFVTAWLAFINIHTGHVEFTNAGHNAPLLKQDGIYSYLKSKAGFVLGGMDGIRYKKNELDLEEGDMLYLYTDGVTEAMNVNKELYGDPQLEKFLNTVKSDNTQEVCEKVFQDVQAYAGEEPQSDDITMLSFIYKGEKNEEN